MMKRHHKAAKAKKTALASVDVLLTDDAGSVDRPHAHVGTPSDQVTWYAYGKKRAVVVFATSNGSPFADSVFHVPAGGSVSSGAPRADAKGKGKSYKYTVIGGSDHNDPDVIIDF